MFLGFCSLVRPQVNFNPEYDHLPFNVKMFGPKGDENTTTYTWRIKRGAKVSKPVWLSYIYVYVKTIYMIHKMLHENIWIGWKSEWSDTTAWCKHVWLYISSPCIRGFQNCGRTPSRSAAYVHEGARYNSRLRNTGNIHVEYTTHKSNYILIHTIEDDDSYIRFIRAYYFPHFLYQE